MCFSRNGAHLGLGLYGLLVGVYEGVLQTEWWHRRVGLNAAPRKVQYPYYLSPSLFLITAWVMGGHEQKDEWNAMMHQYSGLAALVLYLLRCVSYTQPRFSLLCGLVGIFGGIFFCNASEKGYYYWMQLNPPDQPAFENMFGFPVSAIFLMLLMLIVTLALAIFNMICIYSYSLLPPRFKFLNAAQNYVMSINRFWDFFYRLDLIGEKQETPTEYGVLTDDREDREFIEEQTL